MNETVTLVQRLARCEMVFAPAPPGPAAHAVLSNGVELTIPLAGVVDIEKECGRIRAELDGLMKHLGALRVRLANEKFTAKAPPSVVDAEREKERRWASRAEQLQAKVKELCG